MEKDSCQHFRSLLKKNELSQEEEQQLIEHIEICIHCQNHIDMTEKNEPIPALPNERNILRKAKWKQRWNQLSFLFGLALLVYLVGSLFSAAYYGIGDRGEKINAVSNLAIEAFYPGVEVMPRSNKTGVLLSQKQEADLEKMIGNEYFSVGEMHTNARLSFLNSSIEWNNDHNAESHLKFVHPDFPEKIGSKFREEVWEALEKLPEGTVAELGISFNRTLTLEEVYKEINKTTLNEELYHIPWYALDTGHEYQGNLEETSPFLIPGQIFGFPSSIELYPSREEYSDETLEEDVVKMMKLLKDYPNWVKPIYLSGKNEMKLNERYQYVKANGVTTYGIIITGPTKELLKLKNSSLIDFVIIGEIELWNWYSSPFR
ncbi:hypothetical protein CEW92_07160 [Bacillaceae bacterium SAS-127]|nr:hypothetical protein CEW92_07160 [Bacillaceae bacterium SAS-127]